MTDGDYARGPRRSQGPGTDEVWADCIHVACPACRQPAGDKCINPQTEPIAFKAIPCWQRQRAAEAQRV